MAELAIQVKVDASGAIQVLDATGASLAKIDPAARKANDGLGLLGRAWAAVRDNALNLNAALDLAGKAIAAVGAAIETAFSGIETAARTFRESTIHGIGTEFLSELTAVAQAAGKEMDDVLDLVRDVRERVGEATTELARGNITNTFVDAFNRLGAGPEMLKKFATDTEAAVDFVIDKIAEAKDDPRIQFTIQELTNSGFEKFGPIIAALGEQGLDAARDKIRALGLSITEETAALAQKTEFNMGLLGQAFDGVILQLTAGAAPALELVTRKILDVTAELGIGAGGFAEVGESIADAVLRGTGRALEALGGFLDRVHAIGIGGALYGVFEGAFDRIVDLAKIAGARMVAALFSSLDARPGESFVADLADAFGLNPLRNAAQQLSAQADQLQVEFDETGKAALQGNEGVKAAADALHAAGAEFRATADAAGATNEQMKGVGRTAPGVGKGVAAAGAASADAAKAAGDAIKGLVQQQQAAVAASGLFRGSIAAIAAGQQTVAGVTAKAAAEAAGYAQTANQAKVAAAALATEQSKLVAAFNQATATLAEQNATARVTAETWRAAVESGVDMETAQRNVADALLELQLRQAELNGVSAEDIALRREQATAALDYAEAARTAQEAVQGNEQIAQLEEQLRITKEIAAGTLSTVEGEKALAVAAAGTDEVLRQQAARKFELQQAIDDTQAGMIRLGETIKDSLSQVFDALISGTLDTGEAMRSLGLAIGKRWVEGMLDAKLKDFDPAVHANFLDLAESGRSIFSNMWDGVVGLFSGGGGSSGGSSAGGLDVGSLTGGNNGSGLGGIWKWAKGLFGSTDGGSGAGAIIEPIGQNADGSYIYSDGSEGYGQSIAGGGAGGGGGFSAAGALAGAASGYASADYFGKMFINDTGLPSSLKQVQDQALNRLHGINNVISTVLGAVFGGLAGGGGAGGGIIGTIFGIFDSLVGATWGDRIDRDALRNRGFGAFGGAGPVGFDSGSWDLVGATDPLASFVMWQLLGLPTLGTAFRRAGEGVLDESQIFGHEGLQGSLGDFTRDQNKALGIDDNYRTGAATAVARGYTEEQAQQIVGAGESIFSQIFGDEKHQEDAGRLAAEMGQGMAEFLSRGLAEGMTFEQAFAALRGFAQESGVTLKSSLENLPKAMEQSAASAREFGGLDPFAAAQQGADTFASQLLAVTALFQQDYPAGVNLTSLALQSMEKDGVKAFDALDATGRQTLLNLTKDGQLTHDVISKLASDGFTIDTAEFEDRLKDVTASAEVIGGSIGAVFTAPSVSAGLAELGNALQASIVGAVSAAGLEDLFKNTDIAASFEGTFGVLRGLKEGNYADSGGATGAAFREDIVASIAEGKATLDEFIPQLRAIREATDEVNKAIEEALKPTSVEQFWIGMQERFEANKDAIDGMAASLFDVAAQAEGLQPGTGQAAAREAIDTQVDQAAYGAAAAAAGEYATKSPQGEALAAATTEFEFKVAAAFADGVISGEEKTDLARLKAKMDAAGQVLADSVSKGSEQLGDLFKADRLKEAIESAGAALKGALGSGAGSFFDVIQKGGSRSEAISAFGEQFRTSVHENILAGMQEALVQSAVLEGTLGPLMGSLKQAVAVALEDGMIDANEQLFIDTLTGEIGKQTDATIKALEPTLNSLGGIAEKVVGNTDKAKVDVADLDKSTKNASYGVDEMARRAARNLEDVGDAVPPAVTGAIKDGIGALGDALGASGGAGGTPADQIKAGVGALADALGESSAGGAPAEIRDGIGALKDALGGGAGGPADEIKNGLTVLRDAFGPNVGADEMKDTLERLRGAFGAETGGGVAAAADAVRAALGADPASGLAGAADQLRAALGGDGDGVTGAAGELAGKLRDELGSASDDAAASLRGEFSDGLFTAEEAARKLAGVLNSITAPPGFAGGGSMGPGGVAIVGERGLEMVFAHEGGGFTVVPMDKMPHAADGITIGPGGAPTPTRGPDLIPIGPNTGPFGRPRVPPPPAPPRDVPGEAVEVPVILDIQGALSTLASSGDLAKMTKAFDEATGQGIIDGIINGLLASGPIKKALDDFNKQMNDAIAKAVKDGVVTGREASDLADLAEKLGGPIQEQMAALGPAFDEIATRFGLRTVEETTKTGEGVKTILGSAIQSAFSANATFDQFAASLAQTTFNAMSSAIVDSFIQGALAEGALGVVMDQINTTIREMADGTIKQAEGAARLVGLAAEAAGIINSDEMKAAFEGVNKIVDEIAKNLNVTRGTAQTVAREIPPAVAAVEDASAKACEGQCDVKKELATTELGYALLDRQGRGASVAIEEYLKPGESSIFARGSTTTNATDPEVKKLLAEIARKTGSDAHKLAAALESYAETFRGQKLSINADGRELAEVVFGEMEDQSRTGRKFYIRTGELA